jgi:dienelactone hydrolase
VLIEAFGPHAAQMVDGQIAGHGEEPSVKVSPRIEAPDLRGDTQPGLLEKVFGLRLLAHQAEQVAIQPVLIALHQNSERVQVPASKPGNVGVETHSHLHRAGKLAYHTVLYTSQAAKKTHKHKATAISETDISGSHSPQIEILPNPAFVDEPVSVRLSGLRPGAKVTLRAAVRDDAGREWESHGVYIATKDGRIDTSVQECKGGNYRGVDPTGPFWSMSSPGDAGAERATFCKNGAEPDRVRITAEADGARVVSATLERRWLAPNSDRRELNAGGTVGWLFIPPGSERRAVVMVLGGSGGGYDLDKAAVLSRHGFATLALAYFGVPPLPEWLHRVPLEYFAGALEWLSEQPEIDVGRVGVLGISRGAELALLLGSRLPQIRAVAAYAPSAVAWGSGGREKATGEAIPCWMSDEKAIPFAPLPLRGFIARSAIPVGLLRQPVKFRNLFRSALRHREAVRQAAIPVEQTRGPILLVSGGDDRVWPAARMAETIVERLRACGFAHGVEHVNYPRAGHSLRYPAMPTTARMSRSRGMRFPILFGGTAAADAQAQEDAWRRSIAFFQKNL